MSRQTLYLDIETLPSPTPPECDIAPPANYKKPETIEKWWAEEGEAKKREAWDRTAFCGWQGRLACIAWAVEDEPVGWAAAWEVPEDWTLKALLKSIGPNVLEYCGHNVSFDLRFLTARAVTLGVHLPMMWPHGKKPWHEGIRDTMHLATGGEGSIKLSALCRHLGIESADDVDGSQVRTLWEAGEYRRVIDHCIADVERVREIDRRFRAAGI